MAFQVKWVGDPAPTWEIRQNMRDTKALHNYLIANELKRLINRKYFD